MNKEKLVRKLVNGIVCLFGLAMLLGMMVATGLLVGMLFGLSGTGILFMFYTSLATVGTSMLVILTASLIDIAVSK